MPALQAGFSMVESLVSVVVLALGLIGVAGLLMVTLRATNDSAYRTAATHALGEMADRIRANPHADYSATAPALAPACLQTVGCEPAALAAHELASFAARVARDLPAGAALVCRDATPHDGTPSAPACDGAGGAQLAVKVWWDATRSGLASQRLAIVVLP